MAKIPTPLSLGLGAPCIVTALPDALVASSNAFTLATAPLALTVSTQARFSLYAPAISGIISVQGSPTTASVTFSFGSSTVVVTYTPTLTAASLQTSLQTIMPSGSTISVSGSAGGPYTYTITPYQQYGPLIAAVVSSSTPAGATVTIAAAAQALLYRLDIQSTAAGTLAQVGSISAAPSDTVQAVAGLRPSTASPQVSGMVAQLNSAVASGTAPTPWLASALVNPASTLRLVDESQGIFVEPGMGIQLWIANTTTAATVTINAVWAEFAAVP